MYFIRAKYLLYPLFFLIALFVVDKIFLLPEVRKAFVQPGGAMYYYQREAQIDSLKEKLPSLNETHRTLVVFGDSRSFSIGNLAAAVGETMMGYDTRGWRLYNFAAPQAVPAYHAYLAEQLFQGPPERRPEYLILGVAPDVFNRESFQFADPVLKFGVPHEFVRRHHTHIPEKDYDAYVTSRRYALVGMNFSFKTMYQRTLAEFQEPQPLPDTERFAMMGMMMSLQSGDQTPEAIRDIMENVGPYLTAMNDTQEEDWTLYSFEASPQRKLLDLAQGAQYVWSGAAGNRELRNETNRLVNLYFQNYTVSEEQVYYFTETLRLAELAGVKTVVFWPKVNPFLREAYAKDPRFRALWSRLKRITEQHGGLAFDLNHDAAVNCDSYYDASHMSATCYPQVTSVLLQRLKEM